MRVFDTPSVRNVAFVGHGHCGKTSLTSSVLFTAGATDRQLKVEDGNTVTDFDEEEVSRKLTISSSLASFAWQNTKINLIDTPGYTHLSERHARGSDGGRCSALPAGCGSRR